MYVCVGYINTVDSLGTLVNELYIYIYIIFYFTFLFF